MNFSSNDSMLWQTLISWDGHYKASSSGAVAFETFSFRLADQLFNDIIPDKKLRKRYFEGEFWAWNLHHAIDTLSNDKLVKYVQKAYHKASVDFKKNPIWSDMHRIQFGPPQAAIPWIGKRFILNDIPLDGTSHTLNKSAHEFSAKPHRIGYGSNSRHISDLGDKDANYFVLLGGQDGWTSSPHNNDQIALWQKGEYIKFPLLPETIKKTFTHRVFKYGKRLK
jgi:penicillin amidase